MLAWLKRYDWVLLLTVLALVGVGEMMIFSTTAQIGIAHAGDPFFYVKKHSLFLLVGLVFMVIGMRIPYHWYQYRMSEIYIFGVVLVFLPLIPALGQEVGGATRWIQIAGVQFQPIELSKVAILVALASFISRKGTQISDWKRGLFPYACILFLPLLALFFQPDLGNTILCLAVAGLLLFVSGLKLSRFGLIAAVLTVLIGISLITHPYQRARIQSFLNPWEDPLGKNYHIIQSYTAIGSGGLWGVGIGQSKYQHFYLPHHYSDFIFSVLCEETGFLGAVFVLALFLMFFVRGIRIVNQADNTLAALMAMGVMMFLLGQALLNIMVVIGLFPITGIPLPFISYGGSSLMMSLFLVGILLNIGQEKLPPASEA